GPGGTVDRGLAQTPAPGEHHDRGAHPPTATQAGRLRGAPPVHTHGARNRLPARRGKRGLNPPNALIAWSGTCFLTIMSRHSFSRYSPRLNERTHELNPSRKTHEDQTHLGEKCLASDCFGR